MTLGGRDDVGQGGTIVRCNSRLALLSCKPNNYYVKYRTGSQT